MRPFSGQPSQLCAALPRELNVPLERVTGGPRRAFHPFVTEFINEAVLGPPWKRSCRIVPFRRHKSYSTFSRQPCGLESSLDAPSCCSPTTGWIVHGGHEYGQTHPDVGCTLSDRRDRARAYHNAAESNWTTGRGTSPCCCSCGSDAHCPTAHFQSGKSNDRLGSPHRCFTKAISHAKRTRELFRSPTSFAEDPDQEPAGKPPGKTTHDYARPKPKLIPCGLV